MRVTVRVHSHRARHSVWAQCIDTATEDKVPFADGQKDICLTRNQDEGVATLELVDGADLVIYEEQDADDAQQEQYLRTGLK